MRSRKPNPFGTAERPQPLPAWRDAVRNRVISNHLRDVNTSIDMPPAALDYMSGLRRRARNTHPHKR